MFPKLGTLDVVCARLGTAATMFQLASCGPTTIVVPEEAMHMGTCEEARYGYEAEARLWGVRGRQPRGRRSLPIRGRAKTTQVRRVARFRGTAYVRASELYPGECSSSFRSQSRWVHSSARHSSSRDLRSP